MTRLTKMITTNVLTATLFLLAFSGAAFAADAVSPDPNGPLIAFAGPILQAIEAGHGWITAALALIVVAAAVRQYLASRVAFFGSAFGGILILFVGSFGAAVLTGLAAAGTTTLTSALALAALKVALAAAGGVAALRPLLVDIVEPFVVAKLPWTKAIFDLITWAIDQLSGTAPSLQVAQKAGDVAATAHPSTGVAGVTGTPTTVK